MERVRMQQEALARRHFDFDAEQERIECVLELLLIFYNLYTKYIYS